MGVKDNYLVQINSESLATLILLDYLDINDDVKSAGLDPIEHYFENGMAEGRSFSVLFDEAYWRSKLTSIGNDTRKTVHPFFYSSNTCVMPNSWLNINYIIEQNGLSPQTLPQEVLHYVLHTCHVDVHPLFSEDYYRQQAHRQGIAVYGPAIWHYIKIGWRHGLNPHPLFDTWYFYENNQVPQDQCPWLCFLQSDQYLTLPISPFLDNLHLNHMIRLDNDIENVKLTATEFLILCFQHKIKQLHPHLCSSVVNFVAFPGVRPFDIPSEATLKNLTCILSNFYSSPDDLMDSNAKLSVIIVDHKKPVLAMLSAICVFQACINIPHEIILVNNSSEKFYTEIFYRYFENKTSIKILDTRKNVYFGEANNLALDLASGSMVLFLNNDAFIDKQSLQHMVYSLEGDSNLGAVSPVMFNASGHIVEAGCSVSKFFDIMQYGKGRDLDCYLYGDLLRMHPYEVDYASAACLLVRKTVLDLTLGFDYIFEPFYYEDTDLCMRIKQLGYTIKCHTQSFCLHLENTSTKDFLGEEFNPTVHKSKSSFMRKWTSSISKKQHCDCQIMRIPRNFSAAVYTPFSISLGGGENYILSIASVLSKMYDGVTIITETSVSKTRILNVLRDLGIGEFKFTLKTKLNCAGDFYDIAVTIGNVIMPDWIPSARKVFYICQFPFPIYHGNSHFFGLSKQIKTVIVYSNFVQDQVLSQLKKYKVPVPEICVLPPPINNSLSKLESLVAEKVDTNLTCKFISVGRFFKNGHCKNQHLIVKAFDGLSSGKFNLDIYGGLRQDPSDLAYFSQVTELAAGKNITVEANVSNEMIVAAYIKSNFYIHAAGLSTNIAVSPHLSEHFGITPLEAMSFGCIPIVFRSGGPLEFVTQSSSGFTFDNLEQLKKIISDITSGKFGEHCLNGHAQRAYNYAQSFSRESFYRRCESIFTISDRE